MAHEPTIIALIPARANSRRIPGKNIRPLAGHPLLGYTIAAAKESGIFQDILVSTDSMDYFKIAQSYGASSWMRLPEHALDTSPDFEWIEWIMRRIIWEGGRDCFAILRPTSPFRTADTIKRAWQHFLDNQPCDSLRAVEPVKEHPEKMWRWGQKRHYLVSHVANSQGYCLERIQGQPPHSVPSQLLPEWFIQNASLEIAWTRVLTEHHNISGDLVVPFFTEGYEGLDINSPDDWVLAEALLERGLVKLPAL